MKADVEGRKSEVEGRHSARRAGAAKLSTSNPRPSTSAFTLLEVMIAVGVLALLTVTLYSFVTANLQAIRISTEVSLEKQAMLGLVNLVEAQLQELPAGIPGAVLGQPNKARDVSSDELHWVARAGPGVLTSAAPDEYRVTLTVQAAEKGGSEKAIGVRRRLVDEDERNYQWLPLLRPAAALEVRYFDPRLNAWLDRWNDPNARPSLVRLRLWRTAEDQPHEAVIALPPVVAQGIPPPPREDR